MSDTQHDPREVEALANKLVAAYGRGGHLEAARMVLSREAALVAALEELARLGNGSLYGNSVGNMIAQRAIRSHRAAKQPSEPTLREQLERELNSFHPWQEQTVRCIVDLIEGIARERSRDGGK